MGSSDVPYLEPGEFQEGEAVLHVAPAGERRAGVCRQLLTGSEQRADVLRVAYGADAAGLAGSAAKVRVRGNHELVAVGARPETIDAEGRSVATVEDATDLAGVGIVVGERIEAAAGRSRPFRVCFEGTGEIFENASFGTGLEFLHILTRQLSAVDATSHFHVDGARTDQSTISRIAVLFDAVLRESNDGEMAVERG